VSTALEKVLRISIDARGAQAGGQQVIDAVGKIGMVVGDTSAKSLEMEKNLGGSLQRVGEIAVDTASQTAKLDKAMALATRTGDFFRSTISRLFAGASLATSAGILINEFIKLDAAMIGVQNTTGKTGSDLENLRSRIIGLGAALPATTAEVARLVETGSQLGIRGNENLVEFSKVMLQVATAVEVNAESAAKSMRNLARSADEKIDVETFRNLGASINAIRDVTGATGDQLLGLATRIQQVTERFNVGSQESLALAGALSRFGGAAGQSVPVVSRLLDVMDKDFVDAFGGNSITALHGMLTSLKEFARQGGNMEQAAQSLGVNLESRLGRSFLTLVNGADDLAEMLQVVSNKQANLDSLNDESARVWSQLNHQVTQFWEAIKLAGLSLVDDFIEYLKPAVMWLNQFVLGLFVTNEGLTELTDKGRVVAVAMGVVAAILGLIVGVPIVAWLASVASGMGAIISLMMPVIVPALAVLIGLLAAIVAFDMGGYFFNEFKIVQQTAAAAVHILSDGWAYVKNSFSVNVATMRYLWEEMTSQLVSGIGFAIGKVIEKLRFIPEEIRDVIGLGNTALDEWAARSAGLGNNKAVDEAKKKLQDAVGVLNADLAANKAIYDITMKNIETEFQGSDRKTGQSYIDLIGEGAAASFAQVKDFFGTASEEAKKMTASTDAAGDSVNRIANPPNLSALDKLLNSLKKVDRASDNMAKSQADAGQRLREMFSSLEFEITLIGRDAEARERAATAVKVHGAAMKAFNNDLDKSFDATIEYLALLDKLFDAKSVYKLSEMRREISDSIDQFGKSPVERGNSKLIGDYLAESLKRYHGNLILAKADTEEFIDLLRKKDLVDTMQNLSDTIGNDVGGAFRDAVYEAKSFGEIVKGVFLDISKAAFDAFVTKQIASVVSGLASSALGSAAGGLFSSSTPGLEGGSINRFSGQLSVPDTTFVSDLTPVGRASGGFVEGGRDYMVGENGPERLRLTPYGGFVFQNGASGSTTNNRTVTVNMTVQAVDADSFRKSSRQVSEALRQQLNRS